MNVVSDCLLTEALLIGHRSCIGSVYSTYGLRERTNCGRGCSFSFFSCRNYYRDKEALRQMKQKKTCGKNQHVRIDNIYRKANLICCRTDDAVEINLRYYIKSEHINIDIDPTKNLIKRRGIELKGFFSCKSCKIIYPRKMLLLKPK